MDWSNLLSGVIGALLGGLLAIVASLMSARQQRSLTLATLAEERRQTQLQISYSACAEILGDMLTELRSRINQLKDLMEQWYEKTDWVTERSVQQERYDAIMPFMEYVNLSIRAHMNDQPLPAEETPPDLLIDEDPPASADQLSNV